MIFQGENLRFEAEITDENDEFFFGDCVTLVILSSNEITKKIDRFDMERQASGYVCTVDSGHYTGKYYARLIITVGTDIIVCNDKIEFEVNRL